MPNLFDNFKNLLFPQSIPQETCIKEETVENIQEEKGLYGRGLWIWRLDRCEKGDISAIIDKCKTHNIDFLLVKAGDQGSPWKQFDRNLVVKLQKANIGILGWSYDVPNKIDKQVDVIKRVHDLGANGAVIDAEIEWSQGCGKIASEYGSKIKSAIDRPNFLIGDAPWDVPSYHKGFPFKEFSEFVDFHSAQSYWTAHGISVDKTWTRFIDSWSALEKKFPDNCVKKHYPAGSIWAPATEAEVVRFEQLAKSAGLQAVIHWVWDSATPGCWEHFKKTKF